MKIDTQKVIAWAGAAFVIWFVIQQPVQAAAFVHGAGNLLSRAAHGLSEFISHI